MGRGTNMSRCHTFKRKQVHGHGGQICHTVTLLKGSKYMGRGTNMSHCHTFKRKQVHGQGDKYVTLSHFFTKGEAAWLKAERRSHFGVVEGLVPKGQMIGLSEETLPCSRNTLTD